jgi:hypothetical protein
LRRPSARETTRRWRRSVNLDAERPISASTTWNRSYHPHDHAPDALVSRARQRAGLVGAHHARASSLNPPSANAEAGRLRGRRARPRGRLRARLRRHRRSTGGTSTSGATAAERPHRVVLGTERPTWASRRGPRARLLTPARRAPMRQGD